MIEYAERSAGGIEIYEYPSGDPAANASVMEGVSLDNPNERILLNQSSGMAAGAGMNFPPGTGFQNQVDAAHQHVNNAAEVGKIHDEAAAHVVDRMIGSDQ